MKTVKQKLIASILLLISFMLLFSIVSWTILNRSFQEEIHAQLKNLSLKNSEIVKAKLQDNLRSMEILAASIEQLSYEQSETLFNHLQETAEEMGFIRFGFTELNGICYTSDHQTMNLSEYDFYQKALQEETTITIHEQGLFETMDTNIYAVPVYENGVVKAVLHGTQSTKDFASMLITQNLFDGFFSVIVDEQGTVLIDQNLKSEEERTEIRNYSFQNLLTTENVQELTIHDHDYLMTKSDIGMNGWRILSFVPSSIIATKTSDFNTKLIFFYSIVSMILIVFICYIYLSRRRQEKEKEDILFVDKISGLHNYNWFQEQVEAYREKHVEPCVLAIFNIDEFRYLNQQYGYEKGDEILHQFMQHLQVDKEDKLFGARYEKDRYIELLDQSILSKESMIKQYLEALTMKLEEELQIHNLRLSVGFYEWNDPEETLRSASDKVVYTLQEQRHAMIRHYDARMEEKRLYEKELEGRMLEALHQNEFVVYYQPKVRIEDERILRAEALIRWNDPKRGLISPGDFIPLFEKNGFLETVDFFVYEQVCKFIQNYRKEHGEICISFNVSLAYIFHDGFVNRLKQIADSYGVPCSCIEVEITETVAAKNTTGLIELLLELQSYGFYIAMDDFGSGYSSLNMLKELPFTSIKIDQGFFTKQEMNLSKSEAILATIIEMAKKLNLEIVVEGVETKEQLEMIRKMGCHFVQGYYYYKPMPETDFIEVLQEKGIKNSGE